MSSRFAGIDANANDRQCTDFLAHCPEHQRWCLAFVHQAIQRASEAGDIAAE
jgi:hypothetical protein